MVKMKEIQKVAQTLSREQSLQSAVAAAHEPVQKHLVTPGTGGELITVGERCCALRRGFCQ